MLPRVRTTRLAQQFIFLEVECVCVYMYVCIYVCMYVCRSLQHKLRVLAQEYIFLEAGIYACVYVCMYVSAAQVARVWAQEFMFLEVATYACGMFVCMYVYECVATRLACVGTRIHFFGG